MIFFFLSGHLYFSVAVYSTQKRICKPNGTATRYTLPRTFSGFKYKFYAIMLITFSVKKNTNGAKKSST